MHIYLKNNPAKFLPDPIWNDGGRPIWQVLCAPDPTPIFWGGRPNKNSNNNDKNLTSNELGSVPDPTNISLYQKVKY